MSAVPLSPQAMRVAALAVRGLANKDIAYQLGLVEGTVKVYLSRDVYRPLRLYGVWDRYTLMRWWIDHVELRGDCGACLLKMACCGGAPPKEENRAELRTA